MLISGEDGQSRWWAIRRADHSVARSQNASHGQTHPRMRGCLWAASCFLCLRLRDSEAARMHVSGEEKVNSGRRKTRKEIYRGNAAAKQNYSNVKWLQMYRLNFLTDLWKSRKCENQQLKKCHSWFETEYALRDNKRGRLKIHFLFLHHTVKIIQ